MKLTIAEKCRVWMALASYIEECHSLAEAADEENVSSYYVGEVKDATELRKRFRACQFQEE